MSEIDFLKLAAAVVLGYVLLQAFRFLAVYVGILRSPVWPVKVTPLPAAHQLAPDEQAAAEELAKLGFQQVGLSRMETGPIRYDAIGFRHEDGQAFASLGFRAGLTGSFMLEFFSFTADGRKLLTVNRSKWLMLDGGPNTKLEDALADSPAAQWEFHKARMAREQLLSLDGAEAHARQAADSLEILPRMIAAGALTGGQNGTWHYTLRSAWKICRAWWKIRTILTKPYRSAITEGPWRASLFARTFEQFELVNAAKPPRPNVGAGALILTMAASAALWGGFFDWQFAAILVAVILVHEGGHALAMRAFGYRDVTMFFIPFLGAIVTGNPKEMPAWKQAVMLLAGPVPGYLAALGFFVYRALYPFEMGSFDFGEAATIALVVNLLNLVPLSPLDGGQLLEVTVFSRWPIARLVFAGLSVAALAAAAIALKDPFLWAFAAYLAFVFVYRWRFTKLQRAWKEGLSPHDQLVNLFQAARQMFGQQAFAKQYVLVKGVVNQRKILRPRAWESVLAVSIMLIIWAPVGLAFMPRPLWTEAAPAPQDLRADAQKAFDAVFPVDEDKQDGIPTSATAEDLAANLDPTDPRRIDVEVMKALELPEAETRANLEKLLVQRRAGHIYGLPQIAEHLLLTVKADEPQIPLGERIAVLQDTLSRVAAAWPDSLTVTAAYRVRLAELLSESGSGAEAENTLRNLREELTQAKAEPGLLAVALRAETWFRIDRGEWKEAAQFLESAIAARQDLARPLAWDYAWTLLLTSRSREGEQQMRIATHIPKHEPSFFDKAMGKKTQYTLLYPFDYAFAALWGGPTGEAARFVEQDRRALCRREPAPLKGPWYGSRNRAVLAAFGALCGDHAQK